MALPEISNIADALVTALNAASYSQTFTATRKHIPKFDRADGPGLAVRVVPIELDPVDALARDKSERVYTVNVAVWKPFVTADPDPDEIDPYLLLLEEIADDQRLKRLATYATAICIRTETFISDSMRAERAFGGSVALTYKVIR